MVSCLQARGASMLAEGSTRWRIPADEANPKLNVDAALLPQSRSEFAVEFRVYRTTDGAEATIVSCEGHDVHSTHYRLRPPSSTHQQISPLSMRSPPQILFVIMVGLVLVACPFGQAQSRRNEKPIRARPPTFDSQAIQGIFFKDPGSLVTGELPKSSATGISSIASADRPDRGNSPEGRASESDGVVKWNKLISTTSLEDLVKGSKLRLEQLVTTPAAYAGGGYADARREFSLQAVLFAIIEDYPSQDVRWKASAAAAKERMARQAASAKVGSIQAFQAARTGLLDLNDLLNGTRLSGTANQDLEWSQLIDRGPLMQLLEWAQQDYLNPLSSSDQQFADGKDELNRYADMIAILGKMSIQPNMPDANDDDYVAFAAELIEQAQRVTKAIELDDAALARQAAAAIGQSCQDCHDNFR